MLNFENVFGESKNNSEVCETKKEQNEIYYLQYVLYDAGPFRGEHYCLILNF